MTNNHPGFFSRKNFLQICTRISLGLAGVLGLSGLVRFFSHKPDPGPPTSFGLGLLSEFPSGGILIRADIPAVIYRAGDGFRAYSLICTHLGCTLEEAGEGFSCPCHGSEFSLEGKVLKGPAVKELSLLEVEVTAGGELVLHLPQGKLW